ncbi:hypothetical protein AM571_PC00842 (plasmid) [Rhizobium etli 8C-3]|uniref:Uncharacterized protein n=1 Tax=Rhizobium etli 8C-3 TaxID=538025 RepID=A0A1L5PED2_RHIET|nr:hypothetical protein AM571_PC00842 [Rhizobium etli 8C-3]
MFVPRVGRQLPSSLDSLMVKKPPVEYSGRRAIYRLGEADALVAGRISPLEA